jgi:hypothetical protein
MIKWTRVCAYCSVSLMSLPPPPFYIPKYEYLTTVHYNPYSLDKKPKTQRYSTTITVTEVERSHHQVYKSVYSCILFEAGFIFKLNDLLRKQNSLTLYKTFKSLFIKNAVSFIKLAGK